MAHPHMQKVKKNDEPSACECFYISSFHDFFLIFFFSFLDMCFSYILPVYLGAPFVFLMKFISYYKKKKERKKEEEWWTI